MIPIVIAAPDAGLVRSGIMTVESIRWVSKAANAGDDLVIQDVNDNVLFSSVAAGANYVEESIKLRHWENGFKVTTLDSGTLYIEISGEMVAT